MLVQIVTENGQKKIIPLTADAGAGAPVGTIIPMYKKSSPSGYLYCDGSTFDSTAYPLLYAYLGSNVLPDYREFALVGAEENTTDVYNASTNPNGTIHDHDVYTEGQAKDDQVQEHYHNIGTNDIILDYSGTTATTGQNLGGFYIGGTELKTRGESGRKGTVTRGKRKAVYFYIKATSGLSENAQDNVVAQLNEERSYSTEEVNTGKKWIDGKPIYRKVIDFGALPNNALKTVNHNISSIKDITDYFGIFYDNIDTFVKVPYAATTSQYAIAMYVSTSTISISTLTNLSSYTGNAVIEYTKTTD